VIVEDNEVTVTVVDVVDPGPEILNKAGLGGEKISC